MKNYLIAERYAKALSLSVADDADLDSVAKALWDLSSAFETMHDLRNVLSNPAIDLEKRIAVLNKALAGEEIPRPVQRLLEVLMRRGRIAVLPDVAELFAALADERLNRLGARVTTTVALNDAQRQRLGAAIERYCGKSVRLDCKEDPQILGGVVARVGGAVLDGSVRTRLERLRKVLLSEEPIGTTD